MHTHTATLKDMQKKASNQENQILVGVDPGDRQSGIVLLENGKIAYADNCDNEYVFTVIFGANIQKNSNIKIICEDIRPYSLKLSPQIIETCKYIGEIRYRLKQAKIDVQFVPRNEVKKWVFDTFPDVCIPRIEQKIAKKGKLNANGEPRKPSFVWVDDRIIQAAMMKMWGIEKPKPGKKNPLGLKSHSYQALAIVSYRCIALKI
jgi:hypothetical protein